MDLVEVVPDLDLIARYADLVPREAVTVAQEAALRARDWLDGRVVWNVNSTAVGGGVAEMLRPLLAFVRGLGVDARWAVIAGSPAFFRTTKRLHHALHGAPGDGSPLDGDARRLYEDTLRANAIELCARVEPGDVVVLHDPQTAGLAPDLLRRGAHVIWRCHIGVDDETPESEHAWAFLEPYLRDVPRLVFSRPQYVPRVLDAERAVIIAPSVDPFSPKNQPLAPDAVRAILVHVGLLEGPAPDTAPVFTRRGGVASRVDHKADVVRMGRAPGWETPLVVQVSRWDRLKDPVGVMQGFAQLVDGDVPRGAELVLAGPNVRAVADDPEGDVVFRETLEAWRGLPHFVRDRITLASIPTTDVAENAAIINALQRHAAIVVQKSLREGFGLTVTEAMWKSRAVVASGVGGIQDQIQDGVSGILLSDPTDLSEFAAALRTLLEHPDDAERIGQAARERVREHFLGLRHLAQYAALLSSLDD